MARKSTIHGKSGGSKPKRKIAKSPKLATRARVKPPWHNPKNDPPNPLQHPALDATEDRVEYIGGLMLESRWYTHRTKNELAARWGLSPVTIQHIAAEAGRSIDAAIKERRAAVADGALVRLNAIASSKARMPGDLGAIVTANKELLKATGYSEPEEDKSRPTTIVHLGEVVTSPVFAGLLGSRDKSESA